MAVRIRIAAKAKTRAEAEALIEPVDLEIRKRLPHLIMGTDEDTIESVVNHLLQSRDWTLAVAETASGGAMAQRLTRADASQFVGAEVHRLESLDLDDPSQAARGLAERVRDTFPATCGLAVVSDPNAGSTLVTLAHPDGAEEWAFGRAGTSDIMQDRVATVALEFLRRFLVGAPVSAKP